MNDGPDFEPKRKINIFPLILSLLIIALIIVLLVRTFGNSAQEIAYSNIDETFKTTEVDQKPTYVFNWTAKSNYQATQISGEYAYKAETSDKYSRKKFVVYVPNENFTNPFNVTFVNKKVSDDPGATDLINSLDKSIYVNPSAISGGEFVQATHISYQDFFELKVSITKLAFESDSDYYNALLSDSLGSRKNDVGYLVEDAFVVSFWERYGFYIVFGLFEILILFILFRRLSSTMRGSNGQIGGDNIFSFNKSRAKRQEGSKVKFSDVAGCDEEKAELVEMVEYLKEPLKFSKFGAKLPKGVLLVGPPGTGKTLLAKSVAGEAGVPFFSISGSDFVEMFVGVGAGRVRDLFGKAKQNAPCVVFIDEIDAVGRQRGAGLGGGNDEREQTLNQLLVEMDGFTDNQGIIVMAATNRDDVLDPALLRAGRFDRQIIVNLPDRKGREAIFKVHARNKIIDPLVDWEQLAKRTVGFSGADIENVLNEAAILAVRQKHSMVLIEDIDEAIDRRIGGPAKKNKTMTSYEKKSVAYHEAGHAIIGLTLPESDKVQKITIVARGNTGGHVLMTPEDDRFLLTKNELIAKITGYLGGRTSEEIFFNDISTGASNDIEVATRIARLMVTEYGMSSLGPIQYEKESGSVFLGRDYTNSQKNFSNEIAVEIDKEIRKIIDDCHKQAAEIIKKRKNDVILIAETLLEHETITAEEIDYLLKNRHLKSSEESVEKTSPDIETKIESPVKETKGSKKK